jgi:hypothetical protein
MLPGQRVNARAPPHADGAPARPMARGAPTPPAPPPRPPAPPPAGMSSAAAAGEQQRMSASDWNAEASRLVRDLEASQKEVATMLTGQAAQEQELGGMKEACDGEASALRARARRALGARGCVGARPAALAGLQVATRPRLPPPRHPLSSPSSRSRRGACRCLPSSRR